MLLLGTQNNETVDGRYEASDTFNRVGNDARIVPFWVKSGGVQTTRFPGEIFHFKRMCQIPELSSITTEFAEDRETFELGKRTKRVNDGKTFNKDITFKGNDISNIFALTGKVPHNKSTTTVDMEATIEIGKSHGQMGTLIVLEQDATQKVIGGIVITQCEISVLEAPGASDSEQTYVVNIQSKGEVRRFTAGFLPVPFIFYDDGTGSGVTNTAAPNGTLTDFAVKDANKAFTSVPTYGLISQPWRPGASNSFDKYVLEARVGTVGKVNQLITSAGASYNATTSTLTLNAAPADGAVLEGIVLMPSGFPDYEAGRNYFSGDVVRNGSSYWIATTATTEVPTGTPTDWTVLTDQQFPVPYYPSAYTWNNATSHRESNVKTLASLSWTDFMLG